MWPAASAITVRRAPGSTETRARSVPVSRDQPPRLGSGTVSCQSFSRSPASAVTLDRAAGRHLRRVDHERDAAVLARVQSHRRLLEAHRADQRRVGGRARARRAAAGSRVASGSTRAGARRGRAAALEAGGAGRVERGPQRVVERAQADLVARLHRPAGAHEMRAGAPLLGGDDRAQHALDRRVEPLHERVVLVEPGAVDLDHHLRSRRVERRALELLDLLADHLAVEVPRARLALVTGERGLVRGPPGADHQPAEARRARRAERDRLGRPPHDHAGAHAAADLDLVVEQQRPLAVGLGRRQRDELRRLARQLEPQLARGSSSTGRSCTSWPTSRRRRALAGRRARPPAAP